MLKKGQIGLSNRANTTEEVRDWLLDFYKQKLTRYALLLELLECSDVAFTLSLPKTITSPSKC